MPEPFSAERLNQLRQRWERDPKSRAFLQLAEEYRRGGRLAEAVHVLEVGLEEHPTYLSAQVALGRCLLENEAPSRAIEHLERAVARDPMQLVANKLLVEAYLATGQATKARERLDLYKLFNDRDVAVEPLEARIRALGELPRAPLGAATRSRERSSHEGALFNLPPVPALPEVRFEPAAAQRPLREAGLLNEPFGRLYTAGATRRIAAAFSEAGIFPLPPAAERTRAELEDARFGAPVVSAASAASETTAATAVSAGPQEWEAMSWATESAPIPPTPPFTPIFETENESDHEAGIAAEIEAGIAPPDEVPVAAMSQDGWQQAAPPPPAAEPPRAVSATLGELYLAQGHLAEAEESFAAVLRDRPGDAAALAGLQAVRSQRGDEAEAFSDEIVVAEEPNIIVGGLTARKAALLKDYLARIRRGAQQHVS